MWMQRYVNGYATIERNVASNGIVSLNDRHGSITRLDNAYLMYWSKNGSKTMTSSPCANISKIYVPFRGTYVFQKSRKNRVLAWTRFLVMLLVVEFHHLHLRSRHW